MTAAQFKQSLAIDPQGAMAGWAAVHGGAAVIWAEKNANGVTPLASSIPPNAGIGVVYVLRG
jgi:hypothetical protein